MRCTPRVVAFAAVLGLARTMWAQDTLHVMRHAPADTASPSSIITVMFDRPVAGALDDSSNAARFVRITPSVAFTAAWRDPVTIRIVPSEPLRPGERYAVTVGDGMRGADGSRLATAYRFEFRVKGARLVGRSFPAYGDGYLVPKARFQLLYSAPIDTARLARGTRIELAACHDSATTIPLRIVRQRRVANTDPYDFQPRSRYARDTLAARFANVVELEPAAPLPFDCIGNVVIPTTDDDARYGREERYPVKTARTFRAETLLCGDPRACVPKSIAIHFSAPVGRASIERFVRLDGRAVTIPTNDEATDTWPVVADLRPRTRYAIQLDSALHDIYGRAITGTRELQLTTADFVPAILHAQGSVIAATNGPRTLPVRSINVHTLRIVSYRVPDSARYATTASGGGGVDWARPLRGVVPETTLVELPDRLNADTTTEVPLPRMALAADHPLVAVRFEIARPLPDAAEPKAAWAGGAHSLQRFGQSWYWGASGSDVTTVQVTDLALTARLVGPTEGAALVTSLTDGRPLLGATVTQVDATGHVVARGVTNDSGVAVLARIAADGKVARRTNVTLTPNFPGVRVLYAQLGDDRVSVSLGGRAIGYLAQSPLEPSQLGAHTDERPLVAGAIFADRGIFRPKEVVHLKAVLRRGILGDLQLPARRDSVRIVVSRRADSWRDDTPGVVRDTVLHLSEFGTAIDSLRLGASPSLGGYGAELQVIEGAEWRTIQSTEFRVAEYRAPAFLVDITGDDTTRFRGDSLTVKVEGHYLFGAAAAGATVRWAATTDYATRPHPEIEQLAQWSVGEPRRWDGSDRAPRRLTGTATLDPQGRATIRIPVNALAGPATERVRITTAVSDVDRQVVTSETEGSVSASRLYVFIRPVVMASVTGQPIRVELRAVDPTGRPASDASVHAWVIRQHVHRVVNGPAVSAIDTVLDEDVKVRAGAGEYSFVADTAGTYTLVLRGANRRGDTTRTSLVAYVSPPPVVARTPPSWQSSPFHLDVKLDEKELHVGSTAHVRFVSPFDNADAWIKIEREGIFEQRRRRVTRGNNVIEVPIVEKYAPNVFVSVVLLPRPVGAARPDSAAERMRVGYVDLPVSTEPKRLTVALAADRASYAPRDTASIRIAVRDADKRGVRSEVALWAIDEGVLALTGFTTPDILSQIYGQRGVGGQIWSSVPMLLTNDPTLVSVFMRQAMLQLNEMVVTSAVASAPAPTDEVRSAFSSSAFYLGAAQTGSNGETIARARVPDNLTTFRVMAVAVAAGDKYGRGDTTILVTRPLVARAELPRFVRPSDSLVAGVAVTARDGRARDATANAEATGLTLQSPARVSIALTPASAAEARFVFRAPARDAIGDSVSVLLGARDDATADATKIWLPVRPDYHRRTHAVLGATRDTQDVVLELPKDVDPRHSRMRLRIGTSHLSAMLAGVKWLVAYRFDCSEQIASTGRAMIAVWNATKRERTDVLGGDPRDKLQEFADEISKRQLPNGAIAYWPKYDWVSAWLTSYAGLFLLDARDAGVRVDDRVLSRIADFLRRVADAPVDTGGMNRYEQRARRLQIGERVAAVDYLRRANAPDAEAERALLRVVASMTWEDRLHLAEVVAPRADARAEALALVDAAWRTVAPAGHRVDLPDSSHAEREFPSRIAPAARLLSASLALRPDHPLLGALTETVLQQGRAESVYAWSTQDYSSVILALSRFEEGQPNDRVVSARAGERRFVAHPARDDVDTTITAPIEGMLERGANGKPFLRVHVDAGRGDRPVYFALEVDEVPLATPVTPDIHGIVVERWYERYDDGRPVKEVKEGELVRVRLRVTVPADRQFVALEDPLPAGLEPIDNSLRTSATLDPFSTPESRRAGRSDAEEGDDSFWQSWLYGSWMDGGWSPWEHREFHDDRVTYFARALWTGAYTATYVARATVAGSFVAPPASAEEMYNPALQGRSAGSRFSIERGRR
jgi:uncharacterized protein YfaS (alpha-2-macroglobulin family)